jgi:hypothetical protein
LLTGQRSDLGHIYEKKSGIGKKIEQAGQIILLE